MVMLVSQLLGIVLTAQILRVTRPLKAGTNTAATAPVKPQNTLLCFTDCMKSSCLSMLYICGFVIFFCLVSGIISDKLCALSFAGGSKAYIKAIISGFFEMSSGAFSCASVPFPENSVLCSAVTSFAGLAVILQISAVCIPLGLSVKEYIISRLYMAFLCPLITTALLLLLPYDAMCFSSAAAASQNASGAAGVKLITLFVMAVFAVLCAANSAKNVKNAEKKPQ